jgi:hypothetical protein
MLNSWLLVKITPNGRQYEKCRIELNYQFKTNINMKTKTSILTVTKAFFILLVMCCFFSCSVSTSENKKATASNIVVKNHGVKSHGIQILTIDSCEYVWVKNGYGAGLTHKGNCKYCAERARRSLK